MTRSFRRGDIVCDASGSCYVVWSVLEIDGVLCCFGFTSLRKGNVPIAERVHLVSNTNEPSFISVTRRRYFARADIALEGYADPELLRDIGAALRVQAMADNRAVPVRKYAMPISTGRQVRAGTYS